MLIFQSNSFRSIVMEIPAPNERWYDLQRMISMQTNNMNQLERNNSSDIVTTEKWVRYYGSRIEPAQESHYQAIARRASTTDVAQRTRRCTMTGNNPWELCKAVEY